jgi:hypothetical protein
MIVTSVSGSGSGSGSGSAFPAAEMDLRLSYDLSRLHGAPGDAVEVSAAEWTEECFAFTPNAPFQGKKHYSTLVMI